MKRVYVGVNKPYDVVIGGGVLSALGQYVRDVKAPCRVAVITDDNVAPHYRAPVIEALKSAGFAPCCCVIKAGEEHKTLNTYGEVLSFMVANSITRTDMALALGGGVVGDLVGFAAATYQRGIPFVQAPTTLLSAVDASVGGKTAVDLPEGKNLVGAFHQPLLVCCDTDTFQTMDAVRFLDGAAEAVKHGLIKNRALFARMADGAWRRSIDDVVKSNVEVKRDFVVGDERDTGKRQLLNFGHTIGHAVEALSGFSLSHGQAVAVGLVCEMRAARRMGLSPVSENVAQSALKSIGFDTRCPFSFEQVLSVALHDKKRAGDSVTVAYLEDVGQGALKALDAAAFQMFVRSGMEEDA